MCLLLVAGGGVVTTHLHLLPILTVDLFPPSLAGKVLSTEGTFVEAHCTQLFVWCKHVCPYLRRLGKMPVETSKFLNSDCHHYDRWSVIKRRVYVLSPSETLESLGEAIPV